MKKRHKETRGASWSCKNRSEQEDDWLVMLIESLAL